MNEQLLPLIEVLKNADKLEWSSVLYSKGEIPFMMDTVCAVLDEETANMIDNNEKKPDFFIQNELKYVLNIADLQGVIANASEQKERISDEDMLKAFNFYMLNDAFIEFD